MVEIMSALGRKFKKIFNNNNNNKVNLYMAPKSKKSLGFIWH